MKRRGLQPMHDDHINVTPLIDVVMCLIIFFLICGDLVVADMSGKVDLPVAKNGQPLPEIEDRVVVDVMPLPASGGAPDISVLGQTIAYPYDAFAAALQDAVSKHREVKVIVRADKAVPYQFIAPILRICSQERAASVHFATQEE